MELKEMMDLLQSHRHKDAYQVLKELVKRSEASSEVYSYMDTFVKMMEDEDSYIRTRGLRMFAVNAVWDHKNIVRDYIGRYLSHMEDEKPITARRCIQDVPLIAKAKPELIPQIQHALKEIHRIYPTSMQSLIYKDRKKALARIEDIEQEEAQRL